MMFRPRNNSNITEGREKARDPLLLPFELNPAKVASMLEETALAYRVIPIGTGRGRTAHAGVSYHQVSYHQDGDLSIAVFSGVHDIRQATMNLQGKRALITGGSSGIGFAIAEAMLAIGARIVITGRRVDVLSGAAERLRAGGRQVDFVAADVGTEKGRGTTLKFALERLGGLDVLVNNAGGVRAGRLEDTTEAEIRAMIEVDLVAPILLTRAALPALRASGNGLVVNITSGIALVAAPFYATYAGVKGGLAKFGESLRRELKGEGVHVMTVYPGATDTPMMSSSKAGPELGFTREPAAAVADAVIAGIEKDAFEVIRGGEARAKMIALNREDPAALDRRFVDLKAALGEAVRNHSAL
jgi:short-subunit dehydrogenase